LNEVVFQRFIIESINNFKLGGLFVVCMELCIDFVLMDSGRIDCTDMSVSRAITVSESSNIPRAGDSCRVRPLPRNIRNGCLPSNEQTVSS
jgi:hypothetical protein